MPDIKFRRTSLSPSVQRGPRADVGTAAAPAVAAQGLFEAGGGALAQVADRRRKTQMVQWDLERKNELNELLSAEEIDRRTRTGGDVNGVTESFRKRYTEHIQGIQRPDFMNDDEFSVAIQQLNSIYLPYSRRVSLHEVTESRRYTGELFDKNIAAVPAAVALGTLPLDAAITSIEGYRSSQSYRDTLGPDKVDADADTARAQAVEARVDYLARTDPAEAKQFLKSEAFVQNSDLLGSEKVDELERKVAASIQAKKTQDRIDRNEARAAEKEALRVARERTDQEFTQAFVNRELTLSMIIDSQLTAERRTFWMDRLEKRAEDEEPFNNSDPLIRGRATEMVYSRPDETVQGDLDALLGRGLSTDHYGQLSTKLAEKKRQAENDPQKSLAAKQAFGIIDRAEKDGLFYNGTPGVDNTIEAARAKRMLAAWIDANPTEDPIEFINTFMQPVEYGFWESFGIGDEDINEDDLFYRRRAMEALTEQGFPLSAGNIDFAIGQLRVQDRENAGN